MADSALGKEIKQTRDRFGAEIRRLFASIGGWLNSLKQSKEAEVAKVAVTTVIEGGIAIGIGAWVAYKLGTARISSDQLERDNLINLPPLSSVRAWLADEIGLFFGPLLAFFMPENFKNNALFLIRTKGYNSSRSFTIAERDIATEDIAAEGWWMAHWQNPTTNPNDWRLKYGLSPQAVALISGLSIAWAFGSQQAFVEILKKFIP